MTFVDYVNKNITPVELKRRSASRLMKFLGGCLGILRALGMNVPSKQEFMERYTTTIGKTIYYGKWWLKREETIPLEVHELCHILQFKSRWMPLRYLFSQKWRIYYESTAVQAEVVCFPDLKRGDAWFDRRVKQFVKYGIKKSLVTDVLLHKLQGIDVDKLEPEARTILNAYNLYKKEQCQTSC